ncbi:MAG: FtsQ-type POTRA domain-containing protein [Cyanobacteria bacterium P01_F01_bin.53]
MPPKFRSPSSQALSKRRQYLRAKRKYQFYKTAWRAIAMVVFVAGTVWIAMSPVWLIKGGEQLEVSGNQIFSDDNIQALVPVPYPQSLLKVQPDELSRHLENYGPIESAVVSRRLVPPRLHVRVDERIPVAVVIPDTTHPLKAIPTEPIPFKEPGLIDAQGVWLPRNSYRELGASLSLPPLTVRGMQPGSEEAWQTIYQQVSQSPVKITAIDWTRATNLVLQSELGSVHLGPYGRGFEAQLTALDQLRSLDDKVNPEKVAFIDLQDPDNPVIEILQATTTGDL